jgi:GNAT superfamily N-acetyltransferase
VTLNSLKGNRGVGTTLIEAVKAEAQNNNCQRVWLVTSNDNTDALRFYQKRGFVLVALHLGAVAQARAIKPEIPLIGNNGIAIRDEIELETRL